MESLLGPFAPERTRQRTAQVLGPALLRVMHLRDPNPWNLQARHAYMQRLIARLEHRSDMADRFVDALILVLTHTDVHPDDVELAADALNDSEYALHHQLIDLRRIAGRMRDEGRLQRNVALVSRAVRVFQAMASPR